MSGGNLFVIAAPSGAGKTSLVQALMAADPRLRFSVSHTTRRPRPGEENGRDYHFIDEDAFRRMVSECAFRIWRAPCQSISSITSSPAASRSSTSIFILPPSRGELERRLRGRATDSPDVIEQRLALAVAEMRHYGEFEYLVVNDRFDEALTDLQAIVRAARCRTDRQADFRSAWLNDLLA